MTVRPNIIWLYLAIILTAVGLVLVMSSGDGDTAYKAPAVSTPIRSDVTTLVQTRLHQFGYTIAIDGQYGPQTRRIVSLWQKANGLQPDGIAGPATLKSLGPIDDFATATVPAVRTSPPPVPAVSAGTSSVEEMCAEMQQYRQAAGLPEVFDQIGYRESRCRNDVTSSTGCCFGYWQNFLSSHLSRQSAYRDRIINECGVTQTSDIRGLSDAQKRASACVTAVVYSISGMTPWSL